MHGWEDYSLNLRLTKKLEYLTLGVFSGGEQKEDTVLSLFFFTISL